MPTDTTPAGREGGASDRREAPRTGRTPAPDLQPEDAGTPASGQAADPGRGTPAEPAMQQTSKTESETGRG